MRTSILAIVLTFLFSCNFGPSKQEKAEDLVKRYLLQTLLYPSSFQSMKFESVDSVFGSYDKTRDHKILNKKVDSLSLLGAHIYKPKEYYKSVDYQAIDLIKQDSINRANFRPVFSGWSVVHEFRARNNKNKMEQLSLKFTFDRNLDHVIDVEND